MGMNVLQAIKERRSVAPEIFTEAEVSNGDIKTLLEAANWAPTHRKTEPWRFKVVKGEALGDLATFMGKTYTESIPAEKFSEFKKKKTEQKILRSGAVIIICMQRDPVERLPEWEEVAATAMAVQNLWLTAHSLGLGGYWSSPAFIDKMGGFFDLAKGERCLGLFYLGHYEVEVPEGKRTPIADKITWLGI